MKHFFLLLLLCAMTLSIAQTNKITRLLNKQFNAEQKMYEADDDFKPTLVDPFRIENDSLSFTFSQAGTGPGQTIITRRSVHLKDIEEFMKDINILFVTSRNAVRETHTILGADGQILSSTKRFTYLFFTQLSKDPYDQVFFKKMLRAFDRAGYKILGEHWYN